MNAIIFAYKILTAVSWMWSEIEIGICAMENICQRLHKTREKFISFTEFRQIRKWRIWRWIGGIWILSWLCYTRIVPVTSLSCFGFGLTIGIVWWIWKNGNVFLCLQRNYFSFYSLFEDRKHSLRVNHMSLNTPSYTLFSLDRIINFPNIWRVSVRRSHIHKMSHNLTDSEVDRHSNDQSKSVETFHDESN